MKKRLLSLFLSAIMIAGLLPTAALAAAGGNTLSARNTGTVTTIRQNPGEALTLIVELNTEPLRVSAARARTRASYQMRRNTLLNEQISVLTAFAAHGVDAQPLRRYTTVFNGFAIKAHYDDIAVLKADPRVKNVYISGTYDRPTLPTADEGSIEMIAVSPAWTDGYDGAGMLIAVIDSGIDYTHSLLNQLDAGVAGQLTEADINERIANAGSDLNAETGGWLNSKVVFGYNYADNRPDPMDPITNGHGTHVAGIAAANENPSNGIKGVAYNAQLMAMKTFSDAPGSGASDADVLAAVDDAVALGADVINLSLGSPAGLSSYSEAIRSRYDSVYEAARAAGTIVICAAGNDPAMGDLSHFGMPYPSNPEYGLVGSPSSLVANLSVASVDNVLSTMDYAVSPALTQNIYYSDSCTTFLGSSFVELMGTGEFDYVPVPGLGAPEDYANLDVTGKIALVARGTLDFSVKANNAKAAGAVAVVLYNNEPGHVILNITDAEIPLVSITQDDGLAMKNAAEHLRKITFTGLAESFADPAGGRMSNFSAFGVTPELTLKPEITAPGGNIFSTYPNDGYMTSSGTSMASPQVAGGAALVAQRVRADFPGVTGEEFVTLVNNLLMSTASVIYADSADSDAVPYPAQSQGAGLMNLANAVTADAVLIGTDGKSKVELGDGLLTGGSTYDVTFTVENLSDTAASYQVTDAVALYDKITDAMNGGVSDAKLFGNTLTAAYCPDNSGAATYNKCLSNLEIGTTSYAGLTGLGQTFTVPANGSVELTVTFDLDPMNEGLLDEHYFYLFPNGFLLNGFISLSKADDSSPLSIPYIGFAGDWTDAPAFDFLSLYESTSPYAEVDGRPANNPGLPFYGNRIITEDGLRYTGAAAGLGLINRFAGIEQDWMVLGSTIDANGNDVFGTPETVAFSPKGNGFGKFQVGFYLLRNLKDIWVKVTDQTGAVVRSFEPVENGGLVKSYYLPSYDQIAFNDTALYGLEWDGKDSSGNDVPANETYTYTIYGTLPYGDGGEHSMSMDVYVDNTSPSYYTTAKGILHVEDNHYVRELLIKAPVGEGDISQYDEVFYYSFPEAVRAADIDLTKVTSTFASYEGPLSLNELILNELEYGTWANAAKFLRIEVADYAGNYAIGSLASFTGNPTLSSVTVSPLTITTEDTLTFTIDVKGELLHDTVPLVGCISDVGIDRLLFRQLETGDDGIDRAFFADTFFLKPGTNEVTIDFNWVEGWTDAQGIYQMREFVQPGVLTETGTYEIRVQVQGDMNTTITNLLTVVPPEHNLTYAANGGSGADVVSVVRNNTAFTAIDNPFTAPAEKKFREWNTEPDATGTGYAPGAELTMPMANLTLYAIWEDIAGETLTYHANGGIGADITETVKAGNEFTVKPNRFTAPDGMRFKRWNAAADDSGTRYNPMATATMPEADLTLYAIWEVIPTHELTYTANGGIGEDILETVQVGSEFTVAANTFTAPDGMEFRAWNTEADGTGTRYDPDATVIMPAEGLILYAEWRPIPKYLLTYDANGGTGADITEMVFRGTELTVKANSFTAPSGQKFKEWNTEAGGSGTRYAPAAKIAMPAENLTLYAIWESSSTPYTPPAGSGGSPAPAPVPAEPKVPADIKDVAEGAWYYTPVAKVLELGLMKGTGVGQFSPEGTLTRDMFVTILHRLAGEPTPKSSTTFDDVKAGEWYAEAIAWALENDITTGTGNGFGVGTPVTREAMVVFLYRYLQKNDKLGDAAPADLAKFTDGDAVSNWAAEAVAWAVAAGILTGNDKLEINPTGNAKRAEAATLFIRVLDHIEQ